MLDRKLSLPLITCVWNLANRWFGNGNKNHKSFLLYFQFLALRTSFTGQHLVLGGLSSVGTPGTAAKAPLLVLPPRTPLPIPQKPVVQWPDPWERHIPACPKGWSSDNQTSLGFLEQQSCSAGEPLPRVNS